MRTNSFKKLLKSFGFALEGLFWLLKNEQNFKIHFIILMGVTFLSYYFSISKFELLVVILCFSSVLVAEAFNTVIEKFVDWKSPEISAQAKIVKDVAAAAVLLASIFAFIIGLIIFIPYLF